MKTISHDEAFAHRPSDKNIPLNFGNFSFTRSWFRNRNQITWSTYLKPMFDSSKPLKAIQIGVFEFYDAAWLMQNVLIHEKSMLHGVDPWEATTKLSKEYMEECFQRATRNAANFGEKVKLWRGYSSKILPIFTSGQYDLVVIDGDHNASAVLDDAKNALRLLKPGGVMVFDDVRNRIFKEHHVLEGIEMFLKEHEKDVKLTWQHRYADAYIKM